MVFVITLVVGVVLGFELGPLQMLYVTQVHESYGLGIEGPNVCEIKVQLKLSHSMDGRIGRGWKHFIVNKMKVWDLLLKIPTIRSKIKTFRNHHD